MPEAVPQPREGKRCRGKTLREAAKPGAAGAVWRGCDMVGKECPAERLERGNSGDNIFKIFPRRKTGKKISGAVSKTVLNSIGWGQKSLPADSPICDLYRTGKKCSWSSLARVLFKQNQALIHPCKGQGIMQVEVTCGSYVRSPSSGAMSCVAALCQLAVTEGELPYSPSQGGVHRCSVYTDPAALFSVCY